MERRLAAILAADVVGYSAMMERDEKGTHERLVEGRKQLFEPEIARHHGRIFKVMGDGMLAEFGSVVDAVECAVSLQRGLAERNAHVPEDQHVQVRIGINLGEVIVEGEDRFGEGVNIAARLEQLAEPGGICVSGKVAKEVEKKLAFGFEPMGEQKVKNIVEPVQAFRVRLDGVIKLPPRGRRVSLLQVVAVALALVLAAGLAGGAFYWFGGFEQARIADAGPSDGKPSLVVLPFANLSDDNEQGYLADGITEDLTTDLARIPGIFVISRNAAFTYKAKATPPAQIAKELGVRYILEGSTRRVGDDMRINAQLIDAQTGGHLWADRFDGKWAEVFALQDKVIENVAGALKLRLVEGQRFAATAGGTNNPAAYDSYLRGLELSYSGMPEPTAKAVSHFVAALALDPQFGRASAELAYLYWNASGHKAAESALGLSTEEIDAKADAYLEIAAKHPSSTYYWVLAERMIGRQDLDAAVAAAERAIALDPGDPYSHEEMSWVLILSGRPADGLAYIDTVMRIDPIWNPGRRVMKAMAHIGLDDFAAALPELEKADPAAGNSPYWSSFWLGYQRLRLLISVYGHLGRTDQAKAAIAQLTPYLADQGYDTFTVLLAANDYKFKHSFDLDRILVGLRKAGVTELPFGFDGSSKDRLDGSQIAKLVFGNEFKGKSQTSGLAYTRITSPDGSGQVTVGPEVFKNVARIEGDYLCTIASGGGRNCLAFFRNPAGDPASYNEYLMVARREILEFSVVK